MGLLYSRERDWENAQRSFQRAIQLNATLTRTYTNYVTSTLIPLGRVDEATRLLRRGLASRSAVIGCAPGTGDGADHRRKVRGGDRQRRACASRRSRLPIRGFVPCQGPDVRRQAARGVTPVGRAESRAKAAFLDGPCVRHGWPAGGGRKDRRTRLITRYSLAIIYAALGDNDRALLALDRAADILPQRVGLMMMYPEMATLRGDARFAAIRRKLGLP